MSEETFYCKYCDSIKPMSKLVENVDDNERVTWSGCIECHQKRNELMRKIEKVSR